MEKSNLKYNLYIGVDTYDEKRIVDKLLCSCESLEQAKETFRILCGEMKRKAQSSKAIRRYFVYGTYNGITKMYREYFSPKYIEENGLVII